MSDQSQALVPYRPSSPSSQSSYSSSSSSDSNRRENQENIFPPRSRRFNRGGQVGQGQGSRVRHQSQPASSFFSVSYYSQPPFNFYLSARGVVMDHNYSFGSSFNRSIGQNPNQHQHHLPNGYIPEPFLPILGSQQGGNHPSQYQQQQSQPHPHQQQQQQHHSQQQPMYGAGIGQQGQGQSQGQRQPYHHPQNMQMQSPFQPPNVNHYHGSNFNFYFGNAGGYDLNLRMQGMGQNYGDMPFQQPDVVTNNNHSMHGAGPSGNNQYSQQGSFYHQQSGYPSSRQGLSGTMIRPTELSPPPPGNTLAYLAPALPNYSLRRSTSVTSVSSEGAGYQDDTIGYFSQTRK